jgi:hypothetical protein
MTRRILIGVAFLAAAAVVAWLLFAPRRSGPAKTASAAASLASPAPAGKKIKARLFYISEDGTSLAAVDRDVAFGDTAADQAREIVAAQIAPVAAPLVSAIPAGTMLRGVFVTDRGRAYVDLSHEVVSAHTGGTSDELLTVYTIVDALTANLPAITSVQILVDGKQVQTLAGHVDLRRPLSRNLAWVQ